MEPMPDPTSPTEAQVQSFYPALPPPVNVRLSVLGDHPCPYEAGRVASERAVLAGSLSAAVYQRFMDAGFRRSGRLLYQPACRGCRQCVPLRVPVETFKPDKSQRRSVSRNADLVVREGPPQISDEKFALYHRYVRDWHGREEEADPGGLESFLYDSPLETTLEFEYRNASGRLLAVGICDVCPDALSSVYFYFDPAESWRGLGTFGALHEIAFARLAGLSYYYLGYWVAGCRAMRYKQTFGPNELLGTDGAWRTNPPTPGGSPTVLPANR